MLKRHVCKKIFKLFCKCLTFDPEHFLNLVLLNLPAGFIPNPSPRPMTTTSLPLLSTADTILLFIIFSINILYRILFYTNLFPVLSVVSGVPRKIIKTSLYKRINLWYYSLVKTGFACLTVTIQFDSIRYINYTRGDTSSQPSGSPEFRFW